MASEVIKLNLIPKGEMPVFHASQFDTGRLITCELYRGEDAYSVPEGYTVELHCRKVDNNIVTMASTLINDNVVTFTSTEQLTACNGNNLCEVAILDEGYRIGTLNFILEVEIDPLKGGITSTSEIHNLETQIEEITTEIVGENYYNKTEVDDLLDSKADADSVYTIGEVNSLLSGKANAADVYTKSQTDTLLSAKANSSDVYTKSQVDTALSGKADVSDLPDMDLYYTKTATDTLLAAKADAATVTAALATKADKSDTYTKEQVDALIDSIFPTLTASGPIATFTTALNKKLISCTVDQSATELMVCGGNLFDNSDITEDKLINGAGNEVSYASWNISGFIPVVPGISYYLYGLTDHPNTYQDNFELYDATKTKTGFANVKTNEQPYVIPAGVKYVKFSVSDTDLDTAQFALASDTPYTPYIPITVYPVANKDDIVTLTGLNNIIPDTGNITVQYKYMSI